MVVFLGAFHVELPEHLFCILAAAPFVAGTGDTEVIFRSSPVVCDFHGADHDELEGRVMPRFGLKAIE